MYKLDAGLTEAQRQAVEHLDGPLLILAGPGSGKTRVVTHRIANLLAHGVSPREIVALTFTNKAADEMRRRVEELAPGKPVWMSTFHRFCARLVRQHAALVGLSENFTIYDTSDQRATLRRALEALHIDTAHYTPDRIASTISWAKNNLVSPEEYALHPSGPLHTIVSKVYPAYQKALLASNAVDFDDLLYHVAKLLVDSPETRATLDARFRYVLVDEYQDTNRAQYSIVRSLSMVHPNLAVTGDPDQSIYGWRGANLGNILDFERDFPHVAIVKLERNYRSTKSILRVADELISHNRLRKPKRLFTENAEGEPVSLVQFPTQQDEAEAIANRIAAELHSGRRSPRDFAIFYRVNALSRVLEFALREHGIPYQMVHGLEFYQRKEIKDVLGYLRLINNPQDNIAFERIINTPPRKIGKTTVDRLVTHSQLVNKPLLEVARECGTVPGIAARAATQIAKFVALYDQLSLHAATPVEEIIGLVLEETGYRQLLATSDDEQDEDRLANMEELLSAARQFDELHPIVGPHATGPSPLEAFLEQASLVADTDDWQADDDRVTLMTMHAAKGLEFPVVFIVALEEGLLPHERSRNDAQQLEEERRLLFVGITRAQEELQLSWARNREFRGQRRMTIPSQFLMELPRHDMNVIQPPSTTWGYDAHAHDEFADESAGFAKDDSEIDDDALADVLDFFDNPTGDKNVGIGSTGSPDDDETTPIKVTPKLKLHTAADLHRDELATPAENATAVMDSEPLSPRPPVESFTLGMVVKHPEYGLGKIAALSGNGKRRQATVMFALRQGEHKFMLANTVLRPVEGANS